LARDSRTGELGIGVFSAYPSVGMRVAFAAPGIGAVASQARGERSYGPRGLQMLKEGAGARTVVELASTAVPETMCAAFAAAEGEPRRSVVDVRVDHHDDPLPELRRALDFNRAFDLLAVASERGRAGDGDGAMQASLEALQLAPDNPQLLLWMGLGAAEGNLEVGVNLVRRALELQPSLADFLGRLPATAMPSAPAVREQLDGGA
jgi:uncharacterized Ntn-hydrolase superfamily protein